MALTFTSISRASPPVLAATIWIVSSCAGALWLAIWYGQTVFTDMPLFDDWAFLDFARAYSQDETGLLGVLDRHNGHPSVPSRIAFLLAYALTDFNIAWIRWATLVANAACATAVGYMLWRAVCLQRADEGVADPGPEAVLNPALLIGLPLSAVWFLSLAHWETYSVAMCLSNVVVSLCAMLALLCLDAWLRDRRRVWLAAAFILAVAATLSMTQGLLVWGAFAFICVIHPDRRRLRVQAAVFGIVFFAALVWTFFALAGGQGLGARNYENLLLAPVLILGAVLFGFVNNGALVPLDLAAGVAMSGLVLLSGLVFLRMPQAARNRATPFLGMLLVGLGSIAFIAWGRQAMPLEALVAPRYATLAAPALAGMIGVLCVGASTDKLAGQALAALACLAVVGMILTNTQEARMAPYRAIAMQGLEAKLTDPAAPRTPEWFAADMLVYPDFMEGAIRTTDFLDRHDKSVFGGAPSGEPALSNAPAH